MPVTDRLTLDAFHIAQSALERLWQLDDPEYERLRALQNLALHTLVTSQASWLQLRDTFNVNDWVPVLAALGFDHGNLEAFIMLANQGPAGRVEANRLLNWFCRGSAGAHPSLDKATEYYQKCIVNARRWVDVPPRQHSDWHSWMPGHTLGPYWAPLVHYIPSWAGEAAFACHPVMPQGPPVEPGGGASAAAPGGPSAAATPGTAEHPSCQGPGPGGPSAAAPPGTTEHPGGQGHGLAGASAAATHGTAEHPACKGPGPGGPAAAAPPGPTEHPGGQGHGLGGPDAAAPPGTTEQLGGQAHGAGGPAAAAPPLACSTDPGPITAPRMAISPGTSGPPS